MNIFAENIFFPDFDYFLKIFFNKMNERNEHLDYSLSLLQNCFLKHFYKFYLME